MKSNLTTKHLHKEHTLISEETIEAIASQSGLTLTMKGSLKSLAANTHWHFKKEKEKGVLEITLLLETRELIFDCKQNRKDDWVEEEIAFMQKEIQKKAKLKLVYPIFAL